MVSPRHRTRNPDPDHLIMTLSKKFTEVTREALPSVLHGVITDETTVTELCELIRDNPDVAALPLSSIVGKCRRPNTITKLVTRVTFKPAVTVTSSAEPYALLNTRTSEGRDALDASVLISMKVLGVNVAARQLLTAHPGVTANQLRASLTRLCNAGTVTWSGKARGTRYHLVS